MDTYQQIHLLLEEAKSILLCLPGDPSIDALASSLVFKNFLEEENKKVFLLADGLIQKEQLELVPGSENIRVNLPGLKQLILEVDTEHTKLAEFSYETEDKKLKIFLDPESGSFSPNNVRVFEKQYTFDLIITLGVSALASIGKPFMQSPDFFYTVPIINIDYKPTNERFGKINHIPVTTSALSEIIYDFISQNFFSKSIDNHNATLLTTGILSATNGLRSSHVSPQLLKKVSNLLTFNVDIPSINKKLFHSKTLPMIKLWGRVLARLQEAKEAKLVWSIIPHDDFIKTNTTPDDLPLVVEEFISSYTQADLILFLWEFNNNISGLLKTTYRYNALDLTASFAGTGNPDFARFTIDIPSLAEAERQVIEQIKKRSHEMQAS